MIYYLNKDHTNLLIHAITSLVGIQYIAVAWRMSDPVVTDLESTPFFIRKRKSKKRMSYGP